MGDELERASKDQDLEQVSMDEIEAEGATALPNKEVMSLLNVDANVDLGLDLAAPVDLAIAATANAAGVPLLTHNDGDFKLIDDLVDVRAP